MVNMHIDLSVKRRRLFIFIMFAGFLFISQTAFGAQDINIESLSNVDDYQYLPEYESIKPIRNYVPAGELDYVDSYSIGYGWVSDFANMQSDSESYARLSEDSMTRGDIALERLWTPWVPSGWTANGCWEYDPWYAGCARAPGPLLPFVSNSGVLTSPQYDLEGASSFTFSCYINDWNLDSLDLVVYFFNSFGGWEYMFNVDDCGARDSDNWRYKELYVTDARFLHEWFSVRYYASGLTINQIAMVDYHRIEGYPYQRMDCSFHFNSVTGDYYGTETLNIDLHQSFGLETLYVECRSSGDWTRVGSLTALSNSFDVSPYLTGSWFSVRLWDDGSGVIDASPDTWLIERMYLYLNDPLPENVQAPTCDSLYDTDNLYPLKSPHEDNCAHITTYHSDIDGYDTITACLLACYDTGKLWEAQWSNGQFSLLSGGSSVHIVNGTYVGAGNSLNITWHIEVQWWHPDIENLDLEVTTIDGSGAAVNSYNVGWDVENGLEPEWFDFPSNRMNVNTTTAIGGRITFKNSNVTPSNASLDMWASAILETGTNYWNATIGDDGNFVIPNVATNTIVTITDYYVKPVPVGVNPLGINLFGWLYYTNLITDRIKVNSYFSNDTRVDVGTSVNVSVHLTYEYDNTNVTDGYVRINGIEATHLRDGDWYITQMKTDVMAVTYDVVERISGFSSNWVTTVNQNSQNLTQIWDRVIVTFMTSLPERVDVETTLVVWFALAYEFDSQPVTSGDVTISGYPATNWGFGDWRIDRTLFSVAAFTYSVEFSGGVFDLSTVNMNSCGGTVIWDAIEIYDFNSPDWALVGHPFAIYCSARLVYDNHQLGSGDTLVIGNEEALWNGAFFTIVRNYSAPGNHLFYVNSSSDNSFGISRILYSESSLSRVTDVPTITGVTSDFNPNNDLYIGLFGEPLTWIHWDPVNDPTLPSFWFNVSGAYLVEWTLTSSWSSSVFLSGTHQNVCLFVIEVGLPYSLDNYTYTIFVSNEAGFTASHSVFVTVRDYTIPEVISSGDITYEYGTTGHSVNWSASDQHPDQYCIHTEGIAGTWEDWLDGQFSIDVDGYPIGDYNFTLEIHDSWGNSVCNTVIVHVRDTTNPTITHPSDVGMYEGEIGIRIIWFGNDLDPSRYTILRDSVVVKTGLWNSSSELISITLNGLSGGIYMYEILLFDTSDNSVSDMVLVTVEPDSSTSTETTSNTETSTSSTSTTTTSDTPQNPLLIITIVVIGLGSGVVIIVIIFIRFRGRGG